jgi:hypothetical protein
VTTEDSYIVGEHGPELYPGPPAKTAGEEDHSDPDKFRGEPADPPTDDDDEDEP